METSNLWKQVNRKKSLIESKIEQREIQIFDTFGNQNSVNIFDTFNLKGNEKIEDIMIIIMNWKKDENYNKISKIKEYLIVNSKNRKKFLGEDEFDKIKNKQETNIDEDPLPQFLQRSFLKKRYKDFFGKGNE
eukprot:TRINITY_DN2004_c0_g1_i5.p1 TRINITY_DN2004_c0_g1~~TRINITY_DN2004_c0_g1_i5.p1  ORF type:complete len:143 (-),score=33.98 TRINITY_DN2004_c0_g1_i5:430-828(-)